MNNGSYKKPRIVYIGYQTNGKACLSLRRLISEGFNIVLVISNSFVKKRNFFERAIANWPDIRKICAKYKIPLIEVDDNARDKKKRIENRRLLSVFEDIKKAEPDYIVCSTWHWLISNEVANLARCYAVNCHSSLLPRYPGVCPVKAPLINCDKETGVTLHCISSEADLGDIVYQKTIPLHFWDVPYTVTLKIFHLSPEVISNGLKLLMNNSAKLIPQTQNVHIYKRADCKKFWKLYFINHLRRLLKKNLYRI